MNNTTIIFCDLGAFAEKYESIHGHLSLLVCVFGSVANILNICVLTTKEMRWPTNSILTGLAVADLLVMLEYLPFIYNRYLTNRKHANNYSFQWAAFMFFHALFSIVFHFISCCLTVILAIWRYITITSAHHRRMWCSMRTTFYVILATYLICPVVCLPLYLSLKILAHNQTCDEHGNIIERKHLANYTGQIKRRIIYYIHSSHYRAINFWVYGIVIKLLPCLFLIYMSYKLISVLLETKMRRRRLLNNTIPSTNLDSGLVKPVTNRKPDRQADRTSTMLLAVLILFLITELPQSILGLLSAVFGEVFEKQCYVPLGDLMDILALTNSAINFILYCTMSKQFRMTFCEFFKPKVLNYWIPLTQQNHNEKAEKTQLTQV